MKLLTSPVSSVQLSTDHHIQEHYSKSSESFKVISLIVP